MLQLFLMRRLVSLISIFLLLTNSSVAESKKEPNKLLGYQQSKCELKSLTQDYSLEWAFEPLSKNVVFVLKARRPAQNNSIAEAEEDENSNSNSSSFFTGIGFQLSDMSMIDFVQVSVKNQQAGIVDGWVNPLGEILADSTPNIQTISIGTKTKGDSFQVIAKFAKAMFSKDSTHDANLNGCSTFLLPLEILEKTNKLYAKSFKHFQVCDIEKYCTVDLRKLKLKEENTLQKLSAKQIIIPPKKQLNDDETIAKDAQVETAHSVDLSLSGNPCSFVGGEKNYYTVNWTYNQESDCVDFIMRHPIKKKKWWSAVGIGDNMSDMDIGIIFLEDGNPKKMSDYFSSDYTVPDKDAEQNWILHKSKTTIRKLKWGDAQTEEEIVEIHFSRILETKDAKQDRTMNGCVLFQFAANSGAYGPNYSIRKHKEWPDLYKTCDIKEKCWDGGKVNHNHKNKRDEHELRLSPSLDNETIVVEDADLLHNNRTEKTAIVLDLTSTTKDNIVELLTQEITTTTTTTTITSTSTQTSNFTDSSTETNSETSIQSIENITTTSSNPPTSSPIHVPTIEVSNPTTIISLTGDFTAELTTLVPSTIENSTGNFSAETSTENLTTNPPVNIEETTTAQVLTNSSTSIKLTNSSTTLTKETETTTLESRVEIPIATTTTSSLIQGLSDLLSNKSLSESDTSTTPELVQTTVEIKSTKQPEKTEKTEDLVEVLTTTQNPIDVILTSEQTTEQTSNETLSTSVSEILSTTESFLNTETTSETTESPLVLLSNTTTLPIENTSLLEVDKQTENNATESTAIPTFGNTSATLPQTHPTIFPTPTSTTIFVVTGGNLSSGEVSTQPPSSTTVNSITTTIPKLGIQMSGCDETRPDLDVCQSYMKNYFGQVQQWAEKHNEPMENQYGKACKLLSAVPHVPTFCCQIYQSKCQNNL